MNKLPLLISFSLLAIAVACYFFLPGFHAFINEAFEVLTSNDKQRIRLWVNQFSPWGPVVLIIVMIVQMFLFVVPNVFLMIVAIVSYGPIWGALIALAGVFASSSVGYIIGRYFGPVTVSRMMKPSTLAKTRDFIEHYGIAAIAITRISSLSNDSLSIVAGLLKMKYKHYILATLGGIIPLITTLAIFGHNGRILRALIWIAAVSLVILIVYIILDKRRKKGL